MYQNKSRGIVGTIIWCVLCGISVLPAVVLWGITFDTKTYRKMDDPVAMRVMYLVFAKGFPLFCLMVNVIAIILIHILH